MLCINSALKFLYNVLDNNMISMYFVRKKKKFISGINNNYFNNGFAIIENRHAIPEPLNGYWNPFSRASTNLHSWSVINYDQRY